MLEPVRHQASPEGSAPVPEGVSLSLETVLWNRCQGLSPDAQRLLEVIAVAGGPLEQGVAARAAELVSDPMTVLSELRAGHFVRTRGTREVDAVETYHDRIRETGSVDLPLPGTPRRALVALLSRRARLAVRGLKFRPREAAEVSANVLRQIDICYSAALGLSGVDRIYGASFQALQLLLALSAGEPSRIALGLAFEAGHVGCSGGPTRRRTQDLVGAAELLAARLDDPEVHGFTRLMKGVGEWGVGHFRTGLGFTTEAEQILRERCTGVSWQIDTAQVFSMICMTSLGDLRGLSERHPAWLKEARERGDLYATTTLRTF